MEDMNQSSGKTSPALIVIGIIGVILLLGIGGAAGWYFATQKTTGIQTTTTPVSTTTTTPPAPAPVTPEPATNDQLVAWATPTKVTYGPTFDKETYGDIATLKVGEFTSGIYKGGELLVVYAGEQAPASHADFFHFVRLNGKLTLLQKNSDEVQNFSANPPKTLPYDTDSTLELPGLAFPETIKGPSGQVLQRADDIWAMFDSSTYDFLFKEATLGNVYVDKASSTRPENGFYLKAPDGTRRVYYITPPFVSIKDGSSANFNIPSLTWNDGTKNSTEYFYVNQTGCGSQGYAAVIRDEFPQTDLIAAGKTSNGDTVYEFKDTNHAYLKNIYDNEYTVYESGKKKVTYKVFIADHPVFFWKDSFGRLIRFKNNKFVPQAECGKPVIYLYPQQTTDVSVKLDPKGGFSVTEPAYGDGWNVTATPNGQLTEISSGKTYPYLFWEGRGNQYVAPTKGFSVAQKDVHGFLVEKLNALGLNDKETADFIEFWEPRMQGSSYYFVSFYGNTVMNEIAPLNVTPKPDTVIRVLMDFTPLAKPIQVEGFDIHTPTRTGFTLVEWGGVLRGK